MLASLRARKGVVGRLPTLRTTLLLVIPAVVAGLVMFFYLFSGRYVTTDNAYIGAQKVLITPEVSGKVVSIAVQEGQLLKPGDELLAIDPVAYRLAAQEAEARLARVRTDFASLQSSFASLGKQIELSRQALAAAQSDYDRKLALLNNRISTPSDVDRSRALLVAAKVQLEQLQQQEATARLQLLDDPNLSLERFPQYVEALAALDRARRDLAHTTLRAPIAGVATQVASIQMGRYLTAGAAVFSIIDSANVWIEANPKETDLTYVRPGQPVAISVDAFPARRWAGVVGAISPGTGAQFSILPPQNAAGNWIKIVQRVPVRIEFAPGQDLRRLRSGMSALIEIDTGRVGRFASLFSSSAIAEAPEE
ncbi:MAG TPA: HlyD family secretion protein [Hyphomicrobiaceae bacterium]|jgi:membrane fusion protein (multidrug efflux system)|nr:HlyD family secretion protein [Hyphomicrobiaceae bacterium]